MNRRKVIILSMLAVFAVYGAVSMAATGPFGYDLRDDMHRDEYKAQQSQESQPSEQSDAAVEVQPIKTALDFYSFVPFNDLFVESIDSKTSYYSDPTVKSAIARYKSGNYSGALQELYAYVRKGEPNNRDPYAYYYMAMAYSKIGEYKAAENCYQKVINCYAHGKLLELAVKGRDCLTGGQYCQEPINPPPAPKTDEGSDPLDKFVNAPYSGHGFSPELEKEYTQRQLDNIQKTINRKDNLNQNDIDDMNKLKKK